MSDSNGITEQELVRLQEEVARIRARERESNIHEGHTEPCAHDVPLNEECEACHD